MPLLYVATKNAGKMRELRELFEGSSWELETYPGYADVAEGDASYAENAALKARALRSQLAAAGITTAVLGDDSGIEALALGGRPGVRSARYGSDGATWAERRALLRAELAASGSTDRSARFVCALHFISSDGNAVAVEGEVAGAIADRDRGTAGFSYDPTFWYPPAWKTFGELSEVEKNAVSHRARAVAALLSATACSLPGERKSGGSP
jgi:XTP/dITP diphosphohydrolase